MNRRITLVLATVGTLALGATVFHAPIARAADKITSVFVANDPQHPVPVQQQGVVSVRQQGTAQVDDPLAPGRDPSTKNTSDLIHPGEAVTISPNVPPGKRFVATSVSASILSGNSAFRTTAAACALRAGASEGWTHLIATLPGQMSSLNDGRWGAQHTMLTVLEAGQVLTLNCSYAGSVSASTELWVSVGGYFLPA